MSKPRVHLCGAGLSEVASHTDLAMTRRALEPIVELVELDRCEVVHAVSWEPLLQIPTDDLDGKRVLCQLAGAPLRYLATPGFFEALRLVGRWIAQSPGAKAEMGSVGIRSDLIPYAVDTDTFRPLEAPPPEIAESRARLGIPSGAYLIGSFQRDTEERDLRSPKLVKGPDIFVEILRELRGRGRDVCALLAGPRRMWIRDRLLELDLPACYVGQTVDARDDVELNTLPAPRLNELYNLVDLYLITSRSEGAPRTLLEAAASRCKIVSSAVGVAPDLLRQECIFSTPEEAVRVIERDICGAALEETVEPHCARVRSEHVPSATTGGFRQLYDRIDDVPVFQAGRPFRDSVGAKRKRSRGLVEKIRKALTGRAPESIEVCLWHKFFEPPYGGGNQFMLALRRALEAANVGVRENTLSGSVDVHVMNSIHFDVDRLLRARRNRPLRVVHRIDGPISLIRGFDREKDELCFELNAEFASATILQSAWTFQRIVEMGYQPVNPVIIHNAVDPEIFNPRGKSEFGRKRKIRLISTSWSDNPRKGGPIYKWLDENLDWTRFEYTFVGNVQQDFRRIRHVPPVPSRELAEILRQQDVYVTASANDPCSNALIEAQSCGLPALYRNDGGHPEIVGSGGLPFDGKEDFLERLDELVEGYPTYQRLITAPTMEQVARRYIEVMRAIL